MKKQVLSIVKHILMITAIVSFVTFTSCKPEEPAEQIGITALKFTPTSGTVSYACEINHTNKTIENSNDSLPSYLTDEALKSVTIELTPTIGAKAYVNDIEVSPTAEFDLTQPLTIVVKKEGAQNQTYLLKALKSKNDASAKLGVKLTSDMTSGGLAKYHDMDVAFFNGKFYAITSRYSADFSQSFYEMFTSENGTTWTKNTTTPNSIGGQGARLVVFNNRLYAMGGGRFWGTDENNVAPEASFGLPSMNFWRSWSTADGQTWKVDTVGVKSEEYIMWNGNTGLRKKQPSPTSYVNLAVFNGKIYLKGGKSVSFGQGQPSRLYLSTSDGTNWDFLTVTNAGTDQIIGRTDDAFFVFNNKLWLIGGYKSFISADNALSDIWSSADGLTWTKEADSAPFGKIYGHKVVTDGNTLLLFGGETFNADKTRTVFNKVYRSTDGKTWTEVEMASGFEARRQPPIVVNGSTAWIFGGWGESTGNYAFTDQAKDIQIRDTWTKGIQ